MQAEGASDRSKRRQRQQIVKRILEDIRSIPNVPLVLPNENSPNVSLPNSLNEVADSLSNDSQESISFNLKSSTSENVSFDSSSDIDVNVESFSSITPTLAGDLREWACKHNVTHSAIRDLLLILKKHNSNCKLPSDPRTLLQTARAVTVNECSGGAFAYFGIEKLVKLRILNGMKRGNVPVPVQKSFQNYDQIKDQIITLTIGIDGIPISGSTNSQFWPILGLVDQCVNNSPFVIGIYHGNIKPQNLDFLRQFVSECRRLEENGFVVNSIKYEFRISRVNADAPARAFLKSIKNHNSYFGCERCHQEGEWLGRVVYDEKCGQTRTDTLFRNKAHPEHHTGSSIFLELKIDLVSQFPLDYLHLVCLGITRKIFRQWVKGRIPHKLRHSDVTLMSNRLRNARLYFPSDFPRKPRPLNEIDHFKGTEFRSLLLYTGFPTICGIVPKIQTKVYLYLHVAMYILLSKFSSIKWWNDLSKTLLVKFVKGCIQIFGPEFVTYNVHSVIHIAEDAMVHGDLEKCSTFSFENFMQVLKKSVRSGPYPLQQIAHRISEQEFLSNSFKPSVNILKISIKNGDNCYYISDNRIILLVDKVAGCENTYVCQEYVRKEDVEGYPIKSSLLCIYYVKDLSMRFNLEIKMSDVLCKCIRVPYRQSFLCLPLLHTV